MDTFGNPTKLMKIIIALFLIFTVKVQRTPNLMNPCTHRNRYTINRLCFTPPTVNSRQPLPLPTGRRLPPMESYLVVISWSSQACFGKTGDQMQVIVKGKYFLTDFLQCSWIFFLYTIISSWLYSVLLGGKSVSNIRIFELQSGGKDAFDF